MNESSLDGKRLIILGFGRQGKALTRFAAENGATVVVSDLRSAETLQSAIDEFVYYPVEWVLGEHPLSLLDGADLLAVSGGVPLDAPFVQEAIGRGIPLTNDSQQFLQRSPAPVVGITGSAGKSTTTSLLGAIMQAGGMMTWVGGNLGFPLLDRIEEMEEDHMIVQELSSFQLEIATVSPAIACITNITPNHLDRHGTMDAYTEAKAHILDFQSADDIAVLPESLSHLFGRVKGRLRTFSAENSVQDGAFLRGDDLFVTDGTTEQWVCHRTDIALRGIHNIWNVLTAITLADSAGIPVGAIRDGILRFTGIRHRLQLAGTIDGVDYINDSIATAPERAMAAIRSYSEPVILLAGGKDKELDWQPWADLVETEVKSVVLFGHLAPMVAEILTARSIAYTVVDTVKEAVVVARESAEVGDVVLLSPGGTSYDAYVDFAERGDEFCTIVQEMKAG